MDSKSLALYAFAFVRRRISPSLARMVPPGISTASLCIAREISFKSSLCFTRVASEIWIAISGAVSPFILT